MVSQLLLPMADRDRDVLRAARVRAACKDVAATLGHKAVAELWGCEENAVGLKLSETGRHYVKPTEMISLKGADTRGVIIAAELDVLGYEAPERKATVSADEVLRRLPSVLRELFTGELAELVERKLGLR